MNDTTAIQQRVPDPNEILHALRTTADGEWVCASRLWRMALGGLRLAEPDLALLTQLCNKVRVLVERGHLESALMSDISFNQVELIKINGMVVNPADSVQMGRYVDLHPIAKEMTRCYRLSRQGRKKVASSGYGLFRPVALTTMVFTATACSTIQNTEIPPVRVAAQSHQFVQERTAPGGVVWTVCESDCPVPTPKVIAQPLPMVTVRVPGAPKKNDPAQEPPAEKVLLTTFFKLNAATIPELNKSKIGGLMSGPYNWKSIKVVGRADPLGTLELNQKLAIGRAQEMKRALVAAGLPENQIELEARVEKSAPDSTSFVVGTLPAKIEQQSRRVDVEVLRSKK